MEENFNENNFSDVDIGYDNLQSENLKNNQNPSEEDLNNEIQGAKTRENNQQENLDENAKDVQMEETEQKAESEYTGEETPAEKPIGVYARVNANGFITEINSDIFIDNFDGWVKIDEGFGDKFAHAQSQYFAEPIKNENGEYNHRLSDEM